MGVYIQDVCIPECGATIIAIASSGMVENVLGQVVGEAVPITSGRLIDVDALWVKINKICDRRDAGITSDLTCLQQLLSAIRHAPIIIQANEEGK